MLYVPHSVWKVSCSIVLFANFCGFYIVLFSLLLLLLLSVNLFSLIDSNNYNNNKLRQGDGHDAKNKREKPMKNKLKAKTNWERNRSKSQKTTATKSQIKQFSKKKKSFKNSAQIAIFICRHTHTQKETHSHAHTAHRENNNKCLKLSNVVNSSPPSLTHSAINSYVAFSLSLSYQCCRTFLLSCSVYNDLHTWMILHLSRSVASFSLSCSLFALCVLFYLLASLSLCLCVLFSFSSNCIRFQEFCFCSVFVVLFLPHSCCCFYWSTARIAHYRHFCICCHFSSLC